LYVLFVVYRWETQEEEDDYLDCVDLRESESTWNVEGPGETEHKRSLYSDRWRIFRFLNFSFFFFCYFCFILFLSFFVDFLFKETVLFN
jgi:hypothetical protein